MARLSLVTLAALSSISIGCLRTTGATPIHPALTADSPNAWIYLQTTDRDVDGVYRCYEPQPGQPVCKKAKLITRE